MPSQESYRDVLLRVINEVVAPGATEVDASAKFPRVQIDAFGAAGILGLTVPAECRCSGRSDGTFLDLLHFIHDHAPDQVTADVTRLAVRDEARHVAFGVAHTAHLAASDKAYLGALRQSVERRHSALLDTAGLNAEVFDSLVLLAAGSWSPEAIRRSWQAARDLQSRMDEGRRRRLAYIGFPDDEAAELSALHTRNFM